MTITPEDVAKGALGIEWRDTESAARRVAKHAADLIAEQALVIEASLGVAASLVAAISLLEGGGKKAAPSDKMFNQMLVDYKQALNEWRDAYHAARGQK